MTQPLSTAGPGQSLCPAMASHLERDAAGRPYKCTREYGHALPHEAAGTGGTVHARWVDQEAPVLIPEPSRPARIAALHAAGLFLAENTDLPMPEEVNMVAHVTQRQLLEISQAHVVEINQGPSARWIEIVMGLETLHGIRITYVAFGTHE